MVTHVFGMALLCHAMVIVVKFIVLIAVYAVVSVTFLLIPAQQERCRGRELTGTSAVRLIEPSEAAHVVAGIAALEARVDVLLQAKLLGTHDRTLTHHTL